MLQLPIVPSHIYGSDRPQDEFGILVDNKSQPFEHLWLEKSADGSRFIHPLENLQVQNFIDRHYDKDESVQPLPLEATPFTLVESVDSLAMITAKLNNVDEFAVDLEHNQYRSFQGLVCLMQISTRTEDFVIDTLKLRPHIGPHLREVFKDPSKRKIMQWADRDILALQRDFGIYVCNLFDTGRASRVLKMESNSLPYLLNHFCGVNTNKQYHSGDWRFRPFIIVMLKYARECTHYLLYIFDQMKRKLITASSDENDLLLEVYKRSSEICMKLYEKKQYTETSFLSIYRLPRPDLSAKQLAVAAALYRWRDNLARDRDDGTEHILPNRTLVLIVRKMAITDTKLSGVVDWHHPRVWEDSVSVLSIIKNTIENLSTFEVIAQELKEQVRAVRRRPPSEPMSPSDFTSSLESLFKEEFPAVTKIISRARNELQPIIL